MSRSLSMLAKSLLECKRRERIEVRRHNMLRHDEYPEEVPLAKEESKSHGKTGRISTQANVEANVRAHQDGRSSWPEESTVQR